MSDNSRSTGTFRVKTGLAEMLKGGVIMDVVAPEHARVPSDIRADGGVARTSDPTIEQIKEAVTIPVMAKARIGHFVEAQVLEALEVVATHDEHVLVVAAHRVAEVG